MALVGINKDKDNNYESFYIVMRGSEHDKVFDSGDPIKDWYECTKHFTQHFEETDELNLKMSLDAASFISQSKEYDTINFSYNGEQIETSHHDSKEGIDQAFNKNGWLLLIKKNERPTFEEIKKELN